MKFYITKHALTEGIFEVDGEIGEVCPTCISVKRKNHNLTYTSFYHVEGKEWHKTLKQAKERAEFMRLKKIASLEKQIKRLKL